MAILSTKIVKSISALIIFLTYTLTITEVHAKELKYLDTDGIQTTLNENATTVTSSTTSWSDGWYVVSSSTTINNRISVSGTVNLILCNGATLTANNGIGVGSDATFNVYAQSEDEATMGALTATISNTADNGYCARIGGNNQSNFGSITINGGKITATGFSYAAGIGGGYGSNSGNITINGGIVVANAGDYSYSAGIGGGYSGYVNSITLNGGTISATGDTQYGGAGIGTGTYGGSGTMTITITSGVKQIIATKGYNSDCIGKVSNATTAVNVVFKHDNNEVTGDAKNAVFYDTGEGASSRTIRGNVVNHSITISDNIKANVTANTKAAPEGETITLTVGTAVDVSTLKVNDGTNDLTLTDIGNRQYTFVMPNSDVTVTATAAATYSVTLPANMEIVSATNTADGDGKYISGTVVTFKVSFPAAATNVSDGTNTLTADGSGNYSVTIDNADITITATIQRSATIDLSDAPGNFTAINNDVLTGSTSHTVTIADGAGITLSDATITGGIVCEGTAEITLVGENVVNQTSLNANNKISGIQIGGTGTTLTIKGNGSLTATGGSNAAGIGLGRTWDANATGGSVVIEGGTVTASGGNGIGTGTVGSNMTASLDGIVIKGGTVNASLGNGKLYYGSSVTISAVKIYDGIEKVDASKITTSVTYMHVENETETDVTASASDYFTIIEDGDRRVITPKDETDYTITIVDGIEHGSITGAATAKYGDQVTITVTPDFGYRLSSLVVKDAQNNDVASTGNSFIMPKSNVTVSAVFEQGVHGTTEFAWGYSGSDGFVTEATIYDGVTTVELQQGKSYRIYKYDEYSYRKFLLDNDTYNATIPYSGGTGTFTYANGTNFGVDYNGESGFYDITMTDVGNGKWSVSIQKTVGVIDNIPDQTYTSSEITPEPLVIVGSLNLTKGTDYVYSYTNNTNAGTATVKATFQGDYASLGYVEKTFRIIKLLTHSDITIDTIPDQTYSGSEICPEISVKDGETTLILGTDYTVECSNNVSAGTANMTITGMGDYPGSISKTFEITKAPLTITARNKTIAYGDEPANDGVEYSGFVGEEGVSVLGGVLTYGYNYKKGNKTGEYTITPGGLTADNYEINFVSGTLIVETKKTTFAAIQVFEDENGKRAEIDGEYKGEGAVNIPKDIENVTVEFNRTFTVDKYSTIVLPFGIAAGSVEGAVFYKIDDIDVKIVGNDTIWGPVHITEVTDNIEANTPYLLQPTATKLTFKDPVTLNTSETHPYGFTKAGVQWEFRGTYHYFDFGNDSTQLVGKSYGFVAKDQADGLKVGQFRWTSSKSYILPMRGYLVYRSVEKEENGDVNGGDSPKNAPMPQYVSQSFSAPSVSSIPEALDVEIVDKDGSTTVIGKINTRTGEIRLNSRSVDRWFDLQGRVLNGKPSVKGRYLHNGKIEIVK